MMTEAVEALKIALRQEGDGIMVTFRIQPDDLPKELLCARIMSRWALAFQEIDANEQPVHPIAKAVEKTKRNANVMRAAVACNEQGFQTYLRKTYPETWKATKGPWKERAAEVLRQLIGVDSRSSLATDAIALGKFDALFAHYEIWKRGDNATPPAQ